MIDAAGIEWLEWIAVSTRGTENSFWCPRYAASLEVAVRGDASLNFGSDEHYKLKEVHEKIPGIWIPS